MGLASLLVRTSYSDTFVSDGSSCDILCIILAPLMTCFYHLRETFRLKTSTIPVILTLLVLHVLLSMTRVSYCGSHVAAV